MKVNNFKSLRPLLLAFVLINVVLILAKKWMGENDMDRNVVIIGNLLIFLVSLVTFFISEKATRNPSPQASVRALYMSFLVKFFLLAIAAFTYIMVYKKTLNKPALFICMGLYIVYTVIEVSSLMSMLRKKKDG